MKQIIVITVSAEEYTALLRHFSGQKDFELHPMMYSTFDKRRYTLLDLERLKTNTTDLESELFNFIDNTPGVQIFTLRTYLQRK